MSIDITTLPPGIRQSQFLSEENLKLLLSIDQLPSIDPSFNDDRLKNIVQYYSISPSEMEKELHMYASELLNEGNVNAAWQILLSADNF
jgi:hypothetical protein